MKYLQNFVKIGFLTFLSFINPFFCVHISVGQTVTTDLPFPKPDQPVTITVDVKGTSLQGYTDKVWLWSWIDNAGQAFDAPTNVNPATSPSQDIALMTRSIVDPDIYSITITPTTFFNKPAAEINRIGLKLKSRSWDDNKQSDNDLFIDFFQNGFKAKLIAPVLEGVILKSGESLDIKTATSEVADKIELFFGSTSIASSTNSDQLNYTFVSSASTDMEVKVIATKAGQENQTISFSITVIQPVLVEERPAGMKDGINYIDDQTAILSLQAPKKDFVVVIGDFNDWKVNSSYQMKKTPDGERYWLQVSNLTKGVEYAFQYLVDGEIRIADPYSDKIIDPDDQYIPANSYPNPKPFPEKANYGEWYEKRLSVIQTGQETYPWQVENFEAPKKEELMIYELLVRDFFGADQRNYHNLIDTLSYLKRLGVNAIELMPVTEFNGNDSWGYNPTFMLAPDKAYGTKNMLKQFIDEAHRAGIAVILDIVLNQQDRPNPYLEMYWDGNAPAEDNPWFNRVPKHPFNVFFDMNHESNYTKAFVDTVSNYWLTEYKFDGLRFDLSKGFTQQDNLNNEAGWSAYDASRIALLKRIANKIWSYKPTAYVILEHLGTDQEEKELAEAGMMLWGNMNHAYKEAASGKNSDLSRGYFKNKNWTTNNLITYMESHDEERVMYSALTSGLANGVYNIRSEQTALNRMKLNSAFFFLIPGPKMIWQFGELGFDSSINLCNDGTINNSCRTTAKPPLWNYQQESDRVKLYKVYQKLIDLRKNEAFINGEFRLEADAFVKRISFTHSSMEILAFGNFSTATMFYRPSFPTEGIWYDYLAGDSINVVLKDIDIDLEPGEFHIYTNKKMTTSNENIVPFKSDVVLSSEGESDEEKLIVYPNPSTNGFRVKGFRPGTRFLITDITGRSIPFNIEASEEGRAIHIKERKSGLYILEIKDGVKVKKVKILKE